MPQYPMDNHDLEQIALLLGTSRNCEWQHLSGFIHYDPQLGEPIKEFHLGIKLDFEENRGIPCPIAFVSVLHERIKIPKRTFSSPIRPV